MGSLISRRSWASLTGFLLMKVSRFAFGRLRLDLDKADGFFRHMQILSSSWVSFSHGSNDATKVMGIIVLFIASSHHLDVDQYILQNGFPLWVILAAASAMAVGTYLSVRSFRLIRTMGEKITHLHPVNGFSAEAGGALDHPGRVFLRTPGLHHARGDLLRHRDRAGRRTRFRQLESVPCDTSGLGRHPAVLRGERAPSSTMP